MIKLVESVDLNYVFSFCESSILGTKITCLLKAYGFERDFLDAWLYKEEDKIIAVIIKFFDNITLVSEETDNLSEIRSFIDMIGFSTLCMTEFNAEKLGYNDRTVKKSYIFKGESICDSLDDLTEDYYKDAYRLISKNIPDSFGESEEEYLSFLSDFTYRKRRELARIKGTLINGKVSSTALTSSETENSAIISGVACDLSTRNKGLGKKTVLALANELADENKTVYVIALNESAQGFYEHIGFEFNEKISFIERK